MTADLRRLAVQATPGPWSVIEGALYGKEDRDLAHIHSDLDAAYIVAANPQAILALLDERDDLAMRNSGLEYSAYAWKGQAAEAERRVAALEEGLRAIREHVHALALDGWNGWHGGMRWIDDKARALLASGSAGAGGAAPSKPPYDQYGWREVTQGVAPGWNIPHGECPSCDDASAAHLAGMHDPAALPAEVTVSDNAAESTWKGSQRGER